MTNGGAHEPRSTKNQRRDAAREKARELRERQKKKERRNRVFLQGGIGVAVLVVVGLVVALVYGVSNQSAGANPANMASDGIVIGEGMVAQTSTPLPTDATPTPVATEPASGTVDIKVWVDYLCPFCGQFETTNSEQIEEWVTSGAATVEIHPIAILTSRSNGTKYSERAANAAACVANSSPNSFFDFNNILFQNQPEEGTDGLSDEQLKGYVADAGVEDTATVEQCIDDKTYTSWVRSATERALAGPLPGTSLEAITQTPTVLVNGSQYSGSLTDASEFNSFVLQAAGETYSTSTPTATPEPTETSEPAETPEPTETPAG